MRVDWRVHPLSVVASSPDGLSFQSELPGFAVLAVAGLPVRRGCGRRSWVCDEPPCRADWLLAELPLFGHARLPAAASSKLFRCAEPAAV